MANSVLHDRPHWYDLVCNVVFPCLRYTVIPSSNNGIRIGIHWVEHRQRNKRWSRNESAMERYFQIFTGLVNWHHDFRTDLGALYVYHVRTDVHEKYSEIQHPRKWPTFWIAVPVLLHFVCAVLLDSWLHDDEGVDDIDKYSKNFHCHVSSDTWCAVPFHWFL